MAVRSSQFAKNLVALFSMSSAGLLLTGCPEEEVKNKLANGEAVDLKQVTASVTQVTNASGEISSVEKLSSLRTPE